MSRETERPRLATERIAVESGVGMWLPVMSYALANGSAPGILHALLNTSTPAVVLWTSPPCGRPQPDRRRDGRCGNRRFKPSDLLSMTVAPALEAVNHSASAENSPCSPPVRP
jgi:hypothetical protein